MARRRPVTRASARRGLRGWFSTLLLVVVGFGVLTAAGVFCLRWIDPPVTAFMLQQTESAADRRYVWTDWADISDSAKLAVIASEDQRFVEHAGLDIEAIRIALEEKSRDTGLRGASTITQQLAKNLFLWPGRNLGRKAIEAYFSLLLDALLPKQRILELYLNVAELGPGIYGVGAASRIYFDKRPGALVDAEAALLATVLPNPGRLHAAAPSEYVRERQRWVITQMQRLRAEGVMAEL